MPVRASDAFTNADGTLLTNHSSNWSTQSGTTRQGVIYSNGVGVNGADDGDRGNRYNGVQPNDDQFSTVTFIVLPAQDGSAHCRESSAAETYYAGGMDPNDFGGGAASRIWKLVSGVKTSLGTGSTLVAGDRVRLEVVGSALTLFINGARNFGVSDTAILSGQGGLGVQHGTIEVRVLDDWEVGDFGVPQRTLLGVGT